jgi:hypothetical protein
VTGSRTEVAPELRAPWYAYAFAIGEGFVFFLMIALTGMKGPWWLALSMALACTYPLVAYTRMSIDGRSFREVFSPRVQSWGLLLDPLLAVAIGLASYERRQLRATGWYTSPWWMLASFLLAVAIFGVWSYSDYRHWVKAGAAAHFNAPSKIAHDQFAFPVLGASLICLCVPVLLTLLWVHSPVPWLIATLVLTWFIAGATHDQKLDIKKLADPYNWKLGQSLAPRRAPQ